MLGCSRNQKPTIGIFTLTFFVQSHAHPNAISKWLTDKSISFILYLEKQTFFFSFLLLPLMNFISETVYAQQKYHNTILYQSKM